jgi:type VI secretion system protein ImpB
MAKESSNRAIAKSGNRKPRVHISYKTYVGDATKVVSLPFVMGVLADLSGKSTVAQPTLKDRRFVEFDSSTFGSKMKAMKPRAAFTVDNKLTKDGGQLSVDLTFESMDDFSPGAIAKKVEPLKKLYDAREKLKNLMSYFDGKDLSKLEEILQNPEIMSALAALPKGEDKPAG